MNPRTSYAKDTNKLSAFLKIVLLGPSWIVTWCARTIFKYNRLERIPLVDLDAPIEDVFDLYDYGQTVESNPDENVQGAISHKLIAGPFHDAEVVEWSGKVCRVTYLSEFADPDRDLNCMLEKYGQDIGWKELESGYIAVRNDERIWLYCSAAPAISVETAEYRAARCASLDTTK